MIHGKPSQLNLISYIAGDFASGKGSLDPIVAAWLAEVKMVDKGYLQAEEEWRARKRAAKNKKEQPEDPKYPVRCLTLNTTVANLADRLANTQGKHAFSFTPEADTVAQKWRTAMSDFSVMLRQAYDGTPYDREAKSAEAVNVHIDKLLWNVVMCGTPDALYRVITNYTDGFQSRVALARTPDNTFSPLSESLYSSHRGANKTKIQQVAHLLPLMSGDVDLPKLEKKGRDWLERIRIETLKKRRQDQGAPALPHLPHGHAHDDLPDALPRGRAAHPAPRTAGGGDATEGRALRCGRTMLQRQQTPQMLATFDVLADYMIDNAMLFFRERIETAFRSGSYVSSGKARSRKSKNDSIYEELADRFTTEEAYGVSVGDQGRRYLEWQRAHHAQPMGAARNGREDRKRGLQEISLWGRVATHRQQLPPSPASPPIATNRQHRYIVTLLHVTCYVKEIPTSHFCCLGLCQIIKTSKTVIKTSKQTIIKNIKSIIKYKTSKENKTMSLILVRTLPTSRSLPPPSSPSRGA